MEPQLETATVLVCGTAIPVTAEELELAGLQVKGPEAFSALGWDGSLANIKACRHLTHLNLTACGLGPKHAADLADVFSSSGCNITTLCLAKNGLTGASFWDDGDLKGGVDSNVDGIITLLVVRKMGFLAHMTIVVMESSRTPNFPVIKITPFLQMSIYLPFPISIPPIDATRHTFQNFQ